MEDIIQHAFAYIPMITCTHATRTHRVGSGSWRTDGVSMMSQQISSDGQTVTVYCNATHLTSFAVLVDLSGTLNPGVRDVYSMIHTLPNVFLDGI